MSHYVMHQPGMPPMPLMAARTGVDPEWGHGTAVYSPPLSPARMEIRPERDDTAAEQAALHELAAGSPAGFDSKPHPSDMMFRYQVTRRFNGGAYDPADVSGTLLVAGLCPDPHGTETRLDQWLVPYAAAARSAGMRQLLAVCLYAARVTDHRHLDHSLHGPVNGYVCAADHLAALGQTLAVAFDTTQYRRCRDCGTPPLLEELRRAGVALVHLDGSQPGARLRPFMPTDTSAGAGRLRVVGRAA